MKVFYPFLFLFFLHTYLYAQPMPSNEVSILSPKAASIIKYGQYPVSLYTGLIDISVPIYTIEGSGITVPITLKYHASGLKFDDVSNEVGLGWTLMAGGVITRSIKGARDGQYETYSKDITKIKTCNSDPSPFSNDYTKLMEVEKGSRLDNQEPSAVKMDGEMDTYSFSFLNHSGSFCFPFSGSEVIMGTRPSTGLFIPASGMKAVLYNQQIEITDTKGVYYKFEVKDVDQNKSYKEYYLTQIISADKADTIDFIYQIMSSNYLYIRRPFINYNASIVTTNPLSYSGVSQSVYTESGGLFYQSLRPPRLTRINFRGGYVSFSYAEVNDIPTWDLQQITIYSNTQVSPLRTVSLTKSPFYNGEQRLDKVTFSNLQGQSYDYEFGYNGEPGDIDGHNIGIDYWGYFNGSTVPNGRQYVPTFDNVPEEIEGTTDRNANEFYMQNGVLNKIIYPTKGYSEFTYEAHKFRYSQGTSIVTGGGLRIKEVRNYLPDGSLAEKKWYKYGESESGWGTANIMIPQLKDFSTQTRVLVTVQGSILSPLLYQERIINTYSSFPKISYFISGSSVAYSKVTEYVGNNTTDYGKTIYRYEIFLDDKIDEYGETYRWNSPDTYLRSNTWKTGKLLSKEVYKKERNTYQKVYSLQNTYKDINMSEFRNVRVLPNVGFEYQFTNASIPDIKRDFCNYPLHRERFGGSSPKLTPYDYFNYYTSTGERVLKSTEEISDGVSTYITYDTYNENGLPTSITRTTSAEDDITTTLKYPTDFAYSPYTDMRSANILTPVIEKTISKNGNLLKRESTTYQFFHNRFFAPKYYSEQFQDGNYETRITYSYGPKGNIREIFKDGATKGVYLWGYNNLYPIAKIRGANYTQVENILGQTLIDRVANMPTPSSSDLASINNLRTNQSFPRAHIATYEYRPLIGMKSKTDPNAITTTYEYDKFGRLAYERDHEENILKKYNYQFVPSAAPWNISVRFDESSRRYSISWEDNSSDETGFEVVVSVDGSAFEPLITTGSDFQFVVDPRIREVGQTVRYGVRSVSSSGTSAYTYSGIFTVPSIIAPSSVKALYNESTARYTVNWKDISNIETNYKVEVSLNNGTYTMLTSSLPENTMSYLDNNVYEIGTTVKYRLTAINNSQQSEGAYSPKYIVPYISAPSDPSGINAVFSTSTEKITITWNDNSDNEQYFELQVNVDGGGWTVLDDEIERTTYTDDSQYEPGEKIKYRVRGTNPRVVSGWDESTEVLVSYSPTMGQANRSQGGILITWDDNSSNENFFRIYRSENGGEFINWTTAGSNSTSKLDVSGLTYGNTYEYRISAVTPSGETPYTETNSVLLLDPPEAPSDLEVVQNGEDIVLVWDDNSNYEDSFIVLIDYGLGGGWVTWATVDSNEENYSFRNENFSGEIGFKVGASNAAGISWGSEEYITIE